MPGCDRVARRRPRHPRPEMAPNPIFDPPREIHQVPNTQIPIDFSRSLYTAVSDYPEVVAYSALNITGPYQRVDQSADAHNN